MWREPTEKQLKSQLTNTLSYNSSFNSYISQITQTDLISVSLHDPSFIVSAGIAKYNLS